jgi:hypothetical protein
MGSESREPDAARETADETEERRGQDRTGQKSYMEVGIRHNVQCALRKKERERVDMIETCHK